MELSFHEHVHGSSRDGAVSHKRCHGDLSMVLLAHTKESRGFGAPKLTRNKKSAIFIIHLGIYLISYT